MKYSEIQNIRHLTKVIPLYEKAMIDWVVLFMLADVLCDILAMIMLSWNIMFMPWHSMIFMLDNDC